MIGILISLGLIIGFQFILVYAAYTIACWGEEVDLQQGFACAAIIAACAIGASKAMQYTDLGLDIVIGIAYVVCIALAFALTTGLPIKNAAIATGIYFVLLVICRITFWLLF